MAWLDPYPEEPSIAEFGPVSGTPGLKEAYGPAREMGGVWSTVHSQGEAGHGSYPEKLGVKGYGPVPGKSGLGSRAMS